MTLTNTKDEPGTNACEHATGRAPGDGHSDRCILDDDTFAKFSALAYNVVGIKISPKKKALVSERMRKRMRQIGLSDFRHYYECVANGESRVEFQAFIDIVATKRTQFGEDPHHMAFLRNWFREAEKAGQTRFRIWSAACSSGEEAYSIGIAARDALSDASRVRILATDTSSQALRKGVCGIYEEKDLEKMPEKIRERYFKTERHQGTVRFRVTGALRRLVTFGHVNLSNLPLPLESGGWDIVCCRNVMPHFDYELRNFLLTELFRLLRPGGLLLVGPAENLSSMLSGFEHVESSIYLKP